MAKLLLILGVAVITAAIVWFATATDTGQAHDLMVSGAYSAGPLLQKIAARFQKVSPPDKVAVNSDGSERGLSDVAQGRADIGLVARDPTPAERGHYHWYPVALDAVAVIAHAGNPVTALTRRQLAAIYTGKVADWSDVQGAGGHITALDAAEDSGLRTVFAAFLRPAGPLTVTGTPQYSQGMLQAVAADPSALGYASFAVTRVPAHPGVETLAIDGVAPTPATVGDRRYPMAHGVYLVTRAAPAGLVERFIRYATSGAVQDLVRGGGFVPAPGGPAPRAGATAGQPPHSQ